MFTKAISSPLEQELQEIAASHGFAPKIRGIDGDVVQMDAISGGCLADIYGDDPAAIPERVWERIGHMLTTLFEVEGIEYVDITAYNFMQDEDGKIWIIDFGDAFYTPKEKEGSGASNWFLQSILSGESGKAWNPDFA